MRYFAEEETEGSKSDVVDWFPIFSFRMYAKANFSQSYLETFKGVDFARDGANFTIDVSEPLDHYISCTPGHVSCLLRGHEYFSFGMKRMLSGVEKLVGLGHPRDLASGSMSDYQLSSLAGNTRSVHYLCCEVFPCCCCGCCTLETQTTQQQQQQQQQQENNNFNKNNH